MYVPKLRGALTTETDQPPLTARDVLTAVKVVSPPAVRSPQLFAVGRPHVLLIAASHLPSTARLAVELHQSDATVSLVAPPGHPARVLRFLKKVAVHTVSGGHGNCSRNACGAGDRMRLFPATNGRYVISMSFTRVPVTLRSEQ